METESNTTDKKTSGVVSFQFIHSLHWMFERRSVAIQPILDRSI